MGFWIDDRLEGTVQAVIIFCLVVGGLWTLFATPEPMPRYVGPKEHATNVVEEEVTRALDDCDDREMRSPDLLNRIAIPVVDRILDFSPRMRDGHIRLEKAVRGFDVVFSLLGYSSEFTRCDTSTRNLRRFGAELIEYEHSTTRKGYLLTMCVTRAKAQKM